MAVGPNLNPSAINIVRKGLTPFKVELLRLTPIIMLFSLVTLVATSQAINAIRTNKFGARCVPIQNGL